jgi:hypothetical protein
VLDRGQSSWDWDAIRPGAERLMRRWRQKSFR